jgi:hypothetical protein
MTSQLLNRSRSGSPHRQVRAERVPQDMNTDVPKVCATCRSGDESLNQSLSQGTAIVGTQHAAAFQVSMLPQRIRQPSCQWNVTRTPTFGRCDVTFPLRPLDAELTLRKINIRPLQCHHFPAAQACFASEQDDQMRVWV